MNAGTGLMDESTQTLARVLLGLLYARCTHNYSLLIQFVVFMYIKTQN